LCYSIASTTGALAAILCIFLQTASQVPRQATPDTSRQSRFPKKQSNTPKTPPIADSIPQSTSTNTSGAYAAGNTSQDNVRVAPVIINSHRDWADYLLLIINLLLTGATFVIAIYAAVQARAAKRSADNDERSVRLTQRADILLGVCPRIPFRSAEFS
jgi:hypothetical protein